jgi:hypothetical protein
MWIVYSLCWYAHSSRSCSGLSVFWHWHYIGLFLLLLVSLSLTLLLLFNGGYLTSARICQPRASIWPLVLSMPRRNDVIHQLVDVAQRSSCVSWSIVINYHSTLLIVLKRPSPFFRSAPIREPVQSGLGWLITRSGSRCFSCPNNPVRFMLRAAYWLLEILFTGTTCLWSIIGQLTTSTM